MNEAAWCGIPSLCESSTVTSCARFDTGIFIVSLALILLAAASLNLKPLAATGAKIRNYTAWTRATDSVGNIETTFNRGRNLSTFQVRKKR